MSDERDEALAAMLDRPARTMEPAPDERLEDVLHRGGRRRLIRSTAIVAAVALFVGAVAWTGLHWLDPGDPAVRTGTDQPAETARTLHDPDHDFTVSVPQGWVVAEENLTPWLVSPSEILSLGTLPLRVSHDPEGGLRLFDAPVAPEALADLTSRDAFVSLQEEGGRPGPFFEDRPDRFGPRPCEDAIFGCNPDHWDGAPFRAWWIPFRDAGKGFYLFVAIGNDATQELRDQAWAVADSLMFESTEP
jgi:hypothetical protein